MQFNIIYLPTYLIINIYIHIYTYIHTIKKRKTKRHNQENQEHICCSILLYFSSSLYIYIYILKLIHSCTLFNFII
ncbi:hypothetical protein LDENG_00017160 [Lucifuga dentata]|nr:hypothetical protein LDENG_00017160 [Lucifuga dentata]